MKTEDSRKLKIISDIDEESFRLFCVEMDFLESLNKKDIYIDIMSSGGSAYAALAFYSRIRHSPCTITIRVYGFVASAAVLVLAAGDHREMSNEAWVMVHEDSGKLNGSVVDLERESGQYRALEDQWAELLAGVTSVSAKHWTALHKKTSYLTAQQCQNLGLIDDILIASVK